MENKSPRVSVVMSVYNRAEYAKEAIESVLNQTFTDFEFIIFDNGSTDSSSEVIKSFAQADNRIIFIKNKKNINYTENLVRGFDMARGEYIARMDDDDISQPERFEQQVKYLDSNPQVAVLGSFIKVFGDSGMKSWIDISDSDELEVALNFFNPICHPAVMIRKSFLTANNLKYNLKELYAEDYCLWKDVVLHGGKIANLPEPLLNYRYHAKSSTKTSRISKIQNASAERTRHILLKRFYNSDKQVAKLRKSVFKYPFGYNNKKRISNILETMKQYPHLVSSTGIEKFKNRYLGTNVVMDIMFSASNEFVPHLATAITSILINSLPFESFRFYILDGGISQENKLKINLCKQIKNFEIEYIAIDNAVFANCPKTPDCGHISKQTYYRYLIPKFKPELDKCLYFDCDIVVEDSLQSLWNTDMGDNYAAAVEELYDGSSDDALKLGLDATFNAGVLLINIKKWAEDGISDKLFENTAILQKKGLLKWMDQDVLNFTFRNKVKFVNPEFNLQWNTTAAENCTKYTEQERLFAYSHPVIIHFNSFSKPWNKTCEHPLWKRYYYYRKYSPFHGIYKKYILRKLSKEFLNIFYRKKYRGNTVKTKIFGVTVFKTIRKDFYSTKKIFGMTVSRKFLAHEFWNLSADKFNRLEKRLKSLENKIAIPDKRIERYEILKNRYNLFERVGTSDTSVFYQIFVDENYKYDINFEPEIILDLGANTGYSAVYFAEKYPKAKIYCLEPDIENYNILVENTKKYPNINCLCGALFNKNCILHVVDKGRGFWGLSVCDEEDYNAESTSGYTFETLLDIWGLNNKILDIVKMDIEGSEKEVFSSCCRWLQNTRLLFIEVHDRFRAGCSKSVLSKILEYDFNMDVKGDNIIFENNCVSKTLAGEEITEEKLMPINR